MTDGPPYAAEWIDDNPFERREISVEVSDGAGNAASDKVVLEPFEVAEVSEVNSVLLEASVQDQKGRFVKGLRAESVLGARERDSAERSTSSGRRRSARRSR